MREKAKKSAFVKNSQVMPTEDFGDISKPDAAKLLPPNFRQLDLSPKEFKFVAIYCSNGFNAEKAAQSAGYLERTKAGYRAIAYSILQRDDVVEAVRAYVDMCIKPYKDRLELELLNYYYKRATYSISTFYNDDFSPKKITTIDPDYLCCIDDVKYTRTGNNDYMPSYSLPNRDLALQALYKFVTGQDLTTVNVLPEDAQKKLDAVYKQLSKEVDIKPKNVKRKRNE